ncbi:hypothetical protein Tco_1177764, partial [Tanacetum coccineum]
MDLTFRAQGLGRPSVYSFSKLPYLRDVEIDDLRRQVQQLQKELARVKVVNEEDEVHDDDSEGEEEYDNPFGSSSASDSGHSSHQHRRVR